MTGTYNEIEAELDKVSAARKPTQEYYKRWNHAQAGNKAMGKVVKIIETTQRFGSKGRGRNVKYLILEGDFVESGERYTGTRRIYLATVLESKLKSMNVAEGDIIGIKCLGKTAKGYYDFVVVKK